MSEWAKPKEELFSTIVLAVATLLSGWSSYQASKWSGEYKLAYAASVRHQVDAAKAENLALFQRAHDVSLFVEWLGAYDRERSPPTEDATRISGFWLDRFRDEMRRAMDAWLALQPFENPDAPPSPFTLPEYQLAVWEEAEQLRARSAQASAAALDFQYNHDRFLAVGVFFSVVLFFAAVGTKIYHDRYRRMSLTASAVFLVIGAALLAALPMALG